MDSPSKLANNLKRTADRPLPSHRGGGGGGRSTRRRKALSKELRAAAKLLGLTKADVCTLSKMDKKALLSKPTPVPAIPPEGALEARRFSAPVRGTMGEGEDKTVPLKDPEMLAFARETKGKCEILTGNSEWSGPHYTKQGAIDGKIWVNNSSNKKVMVGGFSASEKAANTAHERALAALALFVEIAQEQRKKGDKLWKNTHGGREAKARQHKVGKADAGELVWERLWLEIGWTTGAGTAVCRVLGGEVPTLRKSQKFLDRPRQPWESAGAYVRRVAMRRLLFVMAYFLTLHFSLSSPSKWRDHQARTFVD